MRRVARSTSATRQSAQRLGAQLGTRLRTTGTTGSVRPRAGSVRGPSVRWSGMPAELDDRKRFSRRDARLPEERRRLRQGRRHRCWPTASCPPTRADGRRPRRREHVRVHRGRPPGVDRRRARARATRASPAPGWWSPAAWPSATATSSRPRCPRPTRSSGSRARARSSTSCCAARKPTGVRDLLELPRPAPSAPWAYVKVAEGCDRACAFCAIPSFRGKQRSRTPESIEAEARGARRAGRRRDRARRAGPRVVRPRRRRARLARAAAAPPRPARAPHGLARVRLLYLYPSRGASDPLVATMLELPTVVPYFDLSLQHAGAGLLRRMKRWGSGDRFLDDHRRHPRRASPTPRSGRRSSSASPARPRPTTTRCSRSSTTRGSTGPASSRSRARTAPPAATLDGAVADVARARAAARVCRGAGADHAAARATRSSGETIEVLVDGRRRRRRPRRPHPPRGARDRRRRAARRAATVRAPGRARARDGARRRRPRPRREGRLRDGGGRARRRAAPKRFGQSALATPANFVTIAPDRRRDPDARC